MTQHHDIEESPAVLIGLLAAALSGAIVGLVAGAIGGALAMMTWGMT